MIAVFLLGYVCIALEHPLKVNKAATALLLSVILWTAYMFYAPIMHGATTMEQLEHVKKLVTEVQLIEHLGDISEILFFLLGAMTIVELVDVHGGFTVITDKITTKNKRKLLWILAFITFFLSAILDNMTTAIVMTMLLRKIIHDKQDRWLFAGIVIVSANSGGAFSPIGDVTTIMLWIHGSVTTSHLIPELFFPSLISVIVPVAIASTFLKGEIKQAEHHVENSHGHPAANIITKAEKMSILILGVGSLIFVPIFKSITHLPPFLGVFFGMGILWVYTELLYHNKKHVEESRKARITHILSRIDTSTILFFLGILLSVAVLKETHILGDFSKMLDEKVGNFYIINIIIGIISSIVDNVPLVAGAMGMYDIASVGHYAVDGQFWIFLAYCAGVGGSILIIGSAAGVVVMGIEQINFIWYMKKISLITLIGYLTGAAFYIVQMHFLSPIIGG